VVAVPCTTQRLVERRALANCVYFSAGEFGLAKNCVAQAEQLSAILLDYIDVEQGPIGRLDGMKMRDLIRAIGHVIDSDCEPLH